MTKKKDCPTCNGTGWHPYARDRNTWKVRPTRIFTAIITPFGMSAHVHQSPINKVEAPKTCEDCNGTGKILIIKK